MFHLEVKINLEVIYEKKQCFKVDSCIFFRLTQYCNAHSCHSRKNYCKIPLIHSLAAQLLSGKRFISAVLHWLPFSFSTNFQVLLPLKALKWTLTLLVILPLNNGIILCQFTPFDLTTGEIGKNSPISLVFLFFS